MTRQMEPEFEIYQKVRMIGIPPYVKTADPMPMLRPSNVIKLGEEGIILDRRPGGYWGVRFEKGAFLIDSQYLEAVDAPEANSSEE
jgi:hypothetical protein